MSEYECTHCYDGENLTLDYADIDLTNGMIEIDGDDLQITMDEKLECARCGITKEVIAYARIHTWEVHEE